MMEINGAGNREGWEFEYTASALAQGAEKQREFRLGRVAWWTEAKNKVMTEIKEAGIEVSESVASQISNYGGTQAMRDVVAAHGEHGVLALGLVGAAYAAEEGT